VCGYGVKAGKLARHAARRLERLAATPPDRGNGCSISLRGMPRAGLNGWRLRRQPGGMVVPLACAACRAPA